jgi:hypothetical protein
MYIVKVQEISFLNAASVGNTGGGHFSSFYTLYGECAILLSCPEGGGQPTATRTELS